MPTPRSVISTIANPSPAVTRHRDLLVLVRVLHGVVEQVGEHLFERRRIGPHERSPAPVVLDLERKVAAPTDCARTRPRFRAPARRDRPARTRSRGAAARARTRARAAPATTAVPLPRGWCARYSAKRSGERTRSISQRLGRGAQQRQRRLQLMRDVRDEIRLHPRQLRRAAMRLDRQGERHQQQHRPTGWSRRSRRLAADHPPGGGGRLTSMVQFRGATPAARRD